MIRVPARALSPELQKMLDELQAKVDAVQDYATRVETALNAWKGKRWERFQRGFRGRTVCLSAKRRSELHRSA